MRCWKSREDELSRTVFAGQLTIDGDEQAETLVTPKGKPSGENHDAHRTASSLAGEDGPTGDTPMF